MPYEKSCIRITCFFFMLWKCVKLFTLVMITVAKKTKLSQTIIISLIRDQWRGEG